eukprot:s808_g22.t1
MQTSSSSGATAELSGGLRHFSGESEDGKEYRRWKLWVGNKLLTLDKVSAEARGPYVFTLLTGKALEAVEHLDPSSYQCKDGEKAIFKILDKRFPEKDSSDELAEVLNDIFSMRVKDGEGLRAWISRATELFEKCERKAGCKFPDEARGYMVLKWSGLSDEQQAVVKGRALGDFKLDTVARAMRSVYPDFVHKRRSAVALVEDDMPGDSTSTGYSTDEIQGFADVEAFVAEHRGDEEWLIEDPNDVFPESDVAEILATTWKEKRAELSRLQRSRRFAEAKESRRSFRVEIEELKKKTKCNRCGRVGHWARECKQPRDATASSTASGSGGKGKGRELGASYVVDSHTATETGASYVETENQQLHFVASVSNCPTMSQRLMDERASLCLAVEQEVLLVSSPGFGILDSGCGKTIVGAHTLTKFQQIWSERGIPLPQPKKEVNAFKFGNGHREVSEVSVAMPVGIGGRRGTICAAVVQGDAPLLISRPAMKTLQANLNFGRDSLTLFADELEVPVKLNAAGQYSVDVLQFPQAHENHPGAQVPASKGQGLSSNGNAIGPHVQPLISVGPHNPTPIEDKPVPTEMQPSTHEVMSASRKAGGITKKQLRVLKAQVNKGCSKLGKKYLVAEIFSPPRLVPQVEQAGYRGLSVDIKQGWDLCDPKVQDWVARELDEFPPELLLLCPPCTDAGGWFHYNSYFMSLHEVLRRKLILRKHKKFCKRLIRQQLKHGGRVILEHPRGSEYWDDPEIAAWCKELHSFVTDMCCFNLHLPACDGHPKQLIRKPTRLLVSHEDMKSLHKTCPGEAHGTHAVIAGSHPKVGSVSQHCGKYTPEFVREVLKTVPSLRKTEVLLVDDELLCCQHVCHEVLANEVQKVSDDELNAVLLKLHKNMGHPSTDEFIRMLKHGQASSRAISLARELNCAQCEASRKPSIPLPAQVPKVTEFNSRVGLDVKNLPGWKVNQKVKALNITDHATSFQMMIPFFETETSAVLHRLFSERWCSWAGPPREVVMDPARTNLGKDFTEPLEAMGVHVSQTAAGAHWQLGKTEVHGGLFCRVLERVLEQRSPASQEEWLQCVTQSHVKNSTIQTYGYSPCQLVFGRNPSLPGDLLEEPQNVMSSTAPLMDDSIAQACATRAAARQALLELQNSKSMRRALAARPRVSREFQAGDVVAYWRDQKWNKGTLSRGGRWYGSGVVLGLINKNVVIAHRTHIIRCAPEQVRHATQEEKLLVSDPQNELLGIKDLIESGTFRSAQFLDLISQAYPPQEEHVMCPQGAEDHVQSFGRASDASSPESPANVQPVEPSTEAQPISSGDQVDKSPAIEEPLIDTPEPAPLETPAAPSSGDPASSSSYGPVRRTRVPTKSGPLSLLRPTPTQHDDFVEIMHEVLPKLLDEATKGVKRPADAAEESASLKAPRVEDEHAAHYVQHEMSSEEAHEWWQDLQSGVPHEVLISQYFQKRAQKEVPHSKNPPLVQAQVDAAKVTEWNTLINKNAVRLVPPSQAEWIKKNQPNRIMGSRFVITKKAQEDVIENGFIPQADNPEHWKIKARFCLQGHLDPDLSAKAEAGLLQSPTMSQMGRTVLFQLLATYKWIMQLGDVQGAFLEAGPIPSQYRPLYAWLPPGGLPGAEGYELVEVIGNVYGQNDAPAAWYRVFDAEVLKTGFHRSKYDPCLYFMRDKHGSLCGVLGSHVDDTVTGGSGPEYEKALELLKARFPAVNGGLNWVASQSRPDLAAQTSLSQQAFPSPTIHDLCEANNVVRRAKQHADLKITFLSIPADRLRLVCHSDAAFANVGDYTQAGFVIGFTSDALDHGLEAPWTPAIWKSHRLSRAVGSTLAAEAQSMVSATGTLEWTSLLLSEALDGPFDVRTYEAVLRRRKPVVITDCKSLYDHLISVSSPTAVEDRRTSIDIVILRQSMLRMMASVRWVPTNRMIADSLTKNAGDPTDLLRACIREGKYQISPEETAASDRLKPLSAEEQQMLSQLQHRAQLTAFGNHEIEDGNSDWSLASEPGISMTDASKRRLVEFQGEALSHAAAYHPAPAAPVPHCGKSEDQIVVPHQIAELGQTKKGTKIVLPPGVQSLDEWCDTVIEFGKYSGKDTTYGDLVKSSEKEAKGYVKWCIGQADAAEGRLRDLSFFLVAYEHVMSSMDQRPLIPGTSEVRRFRKVLAAIKEKGDALTNHLKGARGEQYLSNCPAETPSDDCVRFNKTLDGVLILTLIHGHPMVETDLLNLPGFTDTWAVTVNGELSFLTLDDIVANTVKELSSLFCGIYPVNYMDTQDGVPGVLYGRYEKDRYGHRSQGNPWVLISASLANLLYQAAGDVKKGKAVDAAVWAKAFSNGGGFTGSVKDFVAAGDSVLLRIKHHMNDGLHLSETWDKFTSLEDTDVVRRFVKFLDLLYDRRRRLVISCAATVEELFQEIRQEVKGDMGELAWRTAMYSADGKAGLSPQAVGTLCEAVRASERDTGRAAARDAHRRCSLRLELCPELWMELFSLNPWSCSCRCAVARCESSLEDELPIRFVEDLEELTNVDVFLEKVEAAVKRCSLPPGAQRTVMVVGDGNQTGTLCNLIAGKEGFESQPGRKVNHWESVDGAISILEMDLADLEVNDTLEVNDALISQPFEHSEAAAQAARAALADLLLWAHRGINVLLYVVPFGPVSEERIRRLIFLTQYLLGTELLLHLYIVVTDVPSSLQGTSEWISAFADSDFGFRHLYTLAGKNPSRFVTLRKHQADHIGQELSFRKALLSACGRHPVHMMPAFRMKQMQEVLSEIQEERSKLDELQSKVRKLQSELQRSPNGSPQHGKESPAINQKQALPVMSGMPAIAATDFEAVAILAERWVRRGNRVPVLDLTTAQRRADPSAAAAFALKTFQDTPFTEACRVCGRWTASWCEGCYAVAADNPQWEFSAVCTECDSEKLVCPRCKHNAITWEAGHHAYETLATEETAAEVQIEQTGDGLFVATAIRATSSGRARAAAQTVTELLASRPAGLSAFLEDLGVRTLADIRFMWSSGHELTTEFENLAGHLSGDMAFAVSSLWTLSMSRASTAITAQVAWIVQERESTVLVRQPPVNEPGEPVKVLSYRRLIDTGGTPHTPTMIEAAASCPHAREQANRMAKLDAFFQLLLEDVLDLNAMGTTLQQLQDPGSLQSLKEMVLAKPSQLSTERLGALMSAYRRWKRFAVAKGYPMKQPSALQLAEFFQTVSRGGPTAASSAWQSLLWYKTNMGVDFPMTHWLVTPYKFVPASHNTTQALELEPWELVNLMLFARRQTGTNLILSCFVLQTALSCVRFEHIQRSRPLSETRFAALYRCSQGKRRIRGARPGYVWATPALEFQQFSLLKVLVEFYKHECLSDVPFLWPQIQLEASDLWEIHQATPFLVSKKMSRSRFLEVFRGMLHQVGVPHEQAATAGFNRLRRFLPTLGNVLRLEPPEMQAVGSWVEIPAGGGPTPQTKSRAVWLMGRHYAGGQADRSAAVKVALMERFWTLFRRKQGDLATTHDHLLPRGSWTWEELAAANEQLPALELKLPQAIDVEVPDPVSLAATETTQEDTDPPEAGQVHDDDSSSTTSSSASDESARGSDVEGVVPLDDMESIQWIKQGNKVHLVRCTDDATRPVLWCRDMAFVQDAKTTGFGFATSARQQFCQRCLARVPRGVYTALAAQCGWVH